MNFGNALEVAYWIEQREKARKNKEAGLPRPWCDDPIINTFRFCNVRREDDRVTRWLAKHWRQRWEQDNFVPAMLLARMINWPPTLEVIGYPDKWDVENIVRAIKRVEGHGKAWTSAYVITTCGKRMDKAMYVVGTVCNAARHPRYQPTPEDTLETFWTRLRGIDGLGAGFIAAQVVADLKYTPLLNKALDWWSFAVPGPGSRRGINRYFGAPLNSQLDDNSFRSALKVMADEVSPQLDIDRLHMQDWQNVMCEYDKWKRAKLGEGRPRQRYSPETAFEV